MNIFAELQKLPHNRLGSRRTIVHHYKLQTKAVRYTYLTPKINFVAILEGFWTQILYQPKLIGYALILNKSYKKYQNITICQKTVKPLSLLNNSGNVLTFNPKNHANYAKWILIHRKIC